MFNENLFSPYKSIKVPGRMDAAKYREVFEKTWGDGSPFNTIMTQNMQP